MVDNAQNVSEHPDDQSAAELTWPNPASAILSRAQFDELSDTANRLLGSREAAAGAVREALARYSQLRTVPAPGTELTFLRSLVLNVARNMLLDEWERS